MDEYIKFMDELPLGVKIIFALPFLDILWTVYRLCKSLRSKNGLGILLSILLLVFHTIMWLVDIVTLALYGKILWFADVKQEDDSQVIDVEKDE